jgi:Zn finger protein HypA/HybF involved in hydrogenase expression
MIRYLLAVCAAVLVVAAALPAKAADSVQVPAEFKFPSSVGEVTFKHQLHIKERSIPCSECHHGINAKKLNTPHSDYFKSSWIKCSVCHEESGKTTQKLYACSGCHLAAPASISDETLSTKVVVHTQCWKCHAVGTAKEASANCETCHSGKKSVSQKYRYERKD